MNIYTGNCIEVMKTFADCSIDAIVTDPPYEIAFMDRSWDSTGIAFDSAVWKECLRILKPGGHLMAFGASRTYHRLAVAIEDSGFEIRDSLMWIYGSGFPKSHNISKAIDKANGKKFGDRFALGRYIRAQREALGYSRTDVDNWFGYRNGCQHWERQDYSGGRIPTAKDYEVLKERLHLNNDWDEFIARIEAERTPVIDEHGNPIQKIVNDYKIGKVGLPLQQHQKTIINVTADATNTAKQYSGWGTALKPAHEPIVLARKPFVATVAENMITHGVGAINIDACRIGDELRWPANIVFDESAAELLDDESNNASRFFYVAKTSISEREAGLEAFDLRKTGGMRGTEENSLLTGDGNERNVMRANHHPTVKPIMLMRHLIRLVTPKSGVVLDPFMGSGSTGCAAVLEDCNFIGIDINAEYTAIAHARIHFWQSEHINNTSQQTLWGSNV